MQGQLAKGVNKLTQDHRFQAETFMMELGRSMILMGCWPTCAVVHSVAEYAFVVTEANSDSVI